MSEKVTTYTFGRSRINPRSLSAGKVLDPVGRLLERARTDGSFPSLGALEMKHSTSVAFTSFVIVVVTKFDRYLS